MQRFGHGRIGTVGSHLADACLVAVIAFGAACTTAPRPAEPPPAPTEAETKPAIADHGDFTVAAKRVDTWNAVGQVLVRLAGVTYEGRALMLGLYAVQYQGEQLLVLTTAQVLRPGDTGTRTRVSAARAGGQPTDSAAARELLRRLQEALPAELARIAAGTR